MGDAGKVDFNAEEGWTLLADGTILTVDVKDAPKLRDLRSGDQTLEERGDDGRRSALADFGS